MGWRGWAPRMTAPSTALPTPAMVTSGQPWMPIDFTEQRGVRRHDERRVDDGEEHADARAASQATRRASTSGPLGGPTVDDHVGAAGLVRADGEVAIHRVDRGRAGCRAPRPQGRSRRRTLCPSSLTSSSTRSPTVARSHLDPTGGGVLDGVLHCFDAAEVQAPSRARRQACRSGGRGPRPGWLLARHDVAHRRGDAVLGEDRRIDAARQVDQAGDRVVHASSCETSTARARSGDRAVRVWARRRLTTRATRCCSAPSWMSRSRRRRSVSWVSTTPSARGLEVTGRGSPGRRHAAPGRCAVEHRRRTRPAWAARPANRRSSTGDSGWSGVFPEAQDAEQRTVEGDILRAQTGLVHGRPSRPARTRTPGARRPPAAAGRRPRARPGPTRAGALGEQARHPQRELRLAAGLDLAGEASRRSGSGRRTAPRGHPGPQRVATPSSLEVSGSSPSATIAVARTDSPR